MKIHNDILWAMEHQCVNAVLLLDLSDAFNMVDHSVLVNILRNKYGINDVSLSWLKNYLHDHRFHVVVEDMISQERTINYLYLKAVFKDQYFSIAIVLHFVKKLQKYCSLMAILMITLCKYHLNLVQFKSQTQNPGWKTLCFKLKI